MPRPRPYIHCIRCHIPLELPAIKRCETETWYIDFSVCNECKKALLSVDYPSIELTISGDDLKMLLRAKSNEVLMATVLPDEAK